MAPLPVILASSSPRRIAILKDLGLKFQCVSPDTFQEVMTGASAECLVVHNALGKALLVAQQVANGLVIGCDTVIVLGDTILGKPHSAENAKEILHRLSGNIHWVVSGLALIDKKYNREWSSHAVTEVLFKKISDDEIDTYVATGEPLDKAGAYAIQEQGRKFVETIKGSETNIVGLPVELLKEGFRCLGIYPQFPVRGN